VDGAKAVAGEIQLSLGGTRNDTGPYEHRMGAIRCAVRISGRLRVYSGIASDFATTNPRRANTDDRMKFVVYRDRLREWRWRIQARNNRIVGDSAEGYKSKSHALAMVDAILKPPVQIVVKK